MFSQLVIQGYDTLGPAIDQAVRRPSVSAPIRVNPRPVLSILGCHDTCFSGDVGGVRLPGPPFLRLPTPPPEFHIESWRESISKLKAVNFSRIAPTHFGIFENATWHLEKLEMTLHDVEEMMETVMPNTHEKEVFRDSFTSFLLLKNLGHGM